MPDFYAQLEALRGDELAEFEVTPETFAAFHKVWANYGYQNAIVGTAQQGGRVIYRKAK
ncbi:MAG TPA: hypothetical protein VGM95_03525 [Lactobacillaceae bacterium]|jgi:hypothetical protein